MPRERSPERDKAFELWKKSNGEMKLKDIAEKLGVSDTQIRKWKNQDKWDEQLKGTGKGTLPKKSKSNGNMKSNVTKPPKAREREEHIEFEPEIENDDLTDKQKIFCLYYVKYWNAGKATKKAGYNCSYPNGFYEIGSQLLKNPQVKAEIDRLKKQIKEGIQFEAMVILQKYLDILSADITDYLRFGQREEQAIGMYGPIYTGKGDDKEPVMQTVNYVDLTDSTEIDGTLITEVKQGKDGISIKLADKMKALEFLTKYYDLLPDKHKRRIDDERLKIEREKVEIARTKATGEGDGDSAMVEEWVSAVMEDGESDETSSV